MMSVDINQWRAAIGCFRVFTSRSESFRCALNFFVVLLQILRLYQFAAFFILISIVTLPFTAAVQFFIGHLIHVSLKAGTPQCDEEQQQICANLRNIYIRCQYFVLPCRTSSGLLCFSYIDDINMYNDLKERGYM